MQQKIKQGYMSEDKIFISTLWCKEPFCVLTWKEDETIEDLKKRYEGKVSLPYGSIEDVLHVSYPENYYELFGAHVHEVDEDDLGNVYYMISHSQLDTMDPSDFVKCLICIPQNWFYLSKFYIEYILPLRNIGTNHNYE